MTVGGQARARHRVLHLQAQQRDRARAAAVGKRCEKPGEQPDADDLAAGAKAADPDGIHQHAAMDGGPTVCLGDDEELTAAQKILHIARQRREIPHSFKDGILRVAQDAERGGGIRAVVEAIFAKSEIGEIVVVEPAQEIEPLGDLARRQWRRGRAQLRDDRPQAFSQQLPIRYGAADIGEYRLEFGGDRSPLGGVRLAGDLDLHPGFVKPGLRGIETEKRALRIAGHVQDRVDDEPNLAAALIHRGGHRIDEKRHVVIDDLDDGARRRPVVRLKRGIVDANPGAAGFAMRCELP